MKHRLGMAGMGTALLLAILPGGARASVSRTLPVDPAKGRAYYLVSLSQQAQYERNYVDALKYLQEAVRADDSPELRIELAGLYSSLNQAGPADDEARRALGQDPSN